MLGRYMAYYNNTLIYLLATVVSTLGFIDETYILQVELNTSGHFQVGFYAACLSWFCYGASPRSLFLSAPGYKKKRKALTRCTMLPGLY